jgi:serine/threonine-protein kinase
MGTVYKAHDPHLDRMVALKVCRIDTTPQDRPKRLERFQREARSAAQIWHPHVCPIYDVGIHDEQPYFVMAYVQGQSLAERLAQQGRFHDVGAAVALIRQLLDALAAVHEHGIVHRDLKPSNVMLDAGGRAVLTDFGLARPEREAERLTSDGAIVGTPAYMAPEQAAGQPERTGPWTDLYSVGVVFFEMLTGRVPFEGMPVAVLDKILREPPPPLSRWRPYLDARLDAILLKALHKEPEARFRSAREFSEALAGLAVAAPAASAPAQSENRATPNHSLSKPTANRMTDAQVLGVLATTLGAGLLAGGITMVFSPIYNSYAPAAVGFGASGMVVGILTLAWLFGSWTKK